MAPSSGCSASQSTWPFRSWHQPPLAFFFLALPQQMCFKFPSSPWISFLSILNKCSSSPPPLPLFTSLFLSQSVLAACWWPKIWSSSVILTGKALTCNRRHKSQLITHISKHTASLLQGRWQASHWYCCSFYQIQWPQNFEFPTIQVCRVEDLLKSNSPPKSVTQHQLIIAMKEKKQNK